MSTAYYYFAASLPMVTWGGKLPMTAEEFLEAAGRLLVDGDRALVERLLAGDDTIATDNAATRAWITFERNLRNEVAVLRAKRAHKDANKHVRGAKENDPWLRGVVEEVSKMDDLLEGQRLIDRARWQFLDELVSGHAFDLETVLCYGLKLQILQRHHNYQTEKGVETFDAIKARELPVQWAASGV